MRNQRGFTLIELLVVIAIIGILATLVVTQLGSARTKARNASAKSDITEMGKAIEVFKTDDNNSSNFPVAMTAAAKIAAAGTGGDTLNATTDCGITGMFNGTQSVAAFTYGLALKQSPSTTYTYRYGTSLAGAACAAGGAHTALAASQNYIVVSNLDTSDSSTSIMFYVYNGSASTVATGGSIPAANLP